MAKTLRFGLGRRLLNGVMRSLLRRGKGPPFLFLLSVRGRKTGLIHSTPVAVMELDDHRWIVAPYGQVDWVRNARAAGEVTIRRGARSETLRPTEVGSTEAVPVLRKTLKDFRVVRPYFDVTADSSDEAIAAEAAMHPVFRLDPPFD